MSKRPSQSDRIRSCRAPRAKNGAQRLRRGSVVLGSALVATIAQVHTADAGVLDEVGFTSLNARTGSDALIARGAGVAVGVVEDASDDANAQFAPDITLPALAGKNYTFTPFQGSASSHATMVSSLIFGSGGIAPGVNNVAVYENNAFVTGTALNGGALLLPSQLGLSVINNSWVGTLRDEDQNDQVVRRLDYMIRRDNVVVVNAVDNDRTNPFPALFASSYNGITVGAALGGVAGGSVGPIEHDDEHGDRVKPDLVVPVATTSEAAAVVSGASALLISEGKARGMKLNPLVVKSVFMASADRLRGWNKGRAQKSDDKKVPLDYELGAGLLRVDKAFDVLTAGRATRRNNVGLDGWDTRQASKKKPVEYVFNFNQSVREFDAALTWNRQIDADFPLEDADTEMADMDLFLSRKVVNRGKVKWKLVARSESDADNVETFFAKNLVAGTYKISVATDEKDYFGLAWDADLVGSPTSLALVNEHPATGMRRTRVDVEWTGGDGGLWATSVPEPTVGMMLLPAVAMMMRRRRK